MIKSIAACDNVIENLNHISDTLEQDTIIKSDDKDSIKGYSVRSDGACK